MTLDEFHEKCFDDDEYICYWCPFLEECNNYFKSVIRDLLEEIKDWGIEV